VNIKTEVLVAYFANGEQNVSLVFSIRRMLLESSAAAPSNETRIAQAPVAERPIALPPENQGSAQWPIFFLFFQVQRSITMQPERWAKRLIARAIPFMTLGNPI
jgi:hypothetical protein